MLVSPGPIIIDFQEIFNLSFPLAIRWYGLLMALGFLVSFYYGYSLMSKKITKEQQTYLFEWAFWGFIGGIIGARLWFVILNTNYFLSSPLESFAIWEGGQSIQGGFLGGFIAALIYYKINKIKLPSFWLAADHTALALPIAQAIGRWGNFFNMEAFGIPSNLPWAVYIPEINRPIKYLGFETFHPTFLYESLFLLLIAGVLYWFYIRPLSFYKKIFKQGSLLFIYFIFYSIGRFFLEFIRTDSLYIGIFPAAQVIALLTIVTMLAILYKFYNKDF